MSKQRVYRALARLEEAVSKDLGGGKWEYKGKTGVWRTTGKAHDRVFIPDDGSGPMGAHPEVKKRMAGGSAAAVTKVLSSRGAQDAKKAMDALASKATKWTRQASQQFGKNMAGSMLNDYLGQLSGTADMPDLDPSDDPEDLVSDLESKADMIDDSIKGILSGLEKMHNLPTRSAGYMPKLSKQVKRAGADMVNRLRGLATAIEVVSK